jgi:hypothetical protein
MVIKMFLLLETLKSIEMMTIYNNKKENFRE